MPVRIVAAGRDASPPPHPPAGGAAMTDIPAVDGIITRRLDASLADLSRLCSQSSVSASGQGIAECAALVGEMLRARGFTVQTIATAGHPVIFGERRGKSDRRMLFYNHYDVQPPEPLELWLSPPLPPTIRH